MCTAVILQRAHAPYPVIVAANRDELYRREARGPEVIATSPRAAGGVDVAGGGSWLGVSERGFLALLTNQPEPGGPIAGVRSRGALVMEVLALGDRAAARRHLASVDATSFNSFNLLFGDADGLEVAYGRQRDPRVELDAVPDGLHILPNGRLDDPALSKVARARALAEPALSDRDLMKALGRVLADHTTPLCIHTPMYGTRSAALIAIEPGRVASFAWAAGPPCTTAFADALPLLES